MIDKKILNRLDCLATAEDIGEVQRRIDIPQQYYWDEVNLDKGSLGKIQKEYKKEVISGKDFQKFFPYFLAVYHENPEEYGHLCRERERDGGRPWSELKTLSKKSS